MQKNTEISERLFRLITNEGVSPNKFALKLGYKRAQTLYDALKKGIYGLDLLQKLAEIFVNVNWLLTGKGEMYVDRVVISEPQEDYSKPNNPEQYRVQVSQMQNQLRIKDNQIEDYLETMKVLRSEINRLKDKYENGGNREDKSKRPTGT